MLPAISSLLDLSFTSFYTIYLTLLRASIQCMTLLALLVSADRVLNVSKYIFITLRSKITKTPPQTQWKYEPLPDDPHCYPKVAIQLPMFNERAVCQAIIDCCCEIEWPASRFMIQVLDDSTDKVTRELVDEKVEEWRERGVNVVCLRRQNRQGYKAGAMKEGMDVLAVAGYEYIAVFDADFKPESDFLLRTVPWLTANGALGYVQSRWVFTNPDESYLTKAQEVSLNYHMRCEQFTHSATGSFFNFNGTAGVWRRACIESAGGWNSRTTVEDMDLSLRAYVKGWKALFLEDVTCLNELPASFFAYRKQQHRWTCGPVQLWMHAARDIWSSSIPIPRKLELIIMYFGVRKVATHFVALGFFCALVPLAVLTPEIRIPLWVLVHLPIAVTMSTAWFTPRGWVYSILYVLFENAMGTVKLWAVVTGLLDLKRAQEWVVTTKLGSSDKRPGTTTATMSSIKLYLGEVGMAVFLLGAGVGGWVAGRHWGMASYLVIQGCVFLAFGFNMVDAGGGLGGRLDSGLFSAWAVFASSSSSAATTSETVLGEGDESYVTSQWSWIGSWWKRGGRKGLGRKKTPRDLRRRQTIPVIQLRSPYDSLPPLPVSTTTTATTTSAAMTTTTTTTAAADGVGVDDDHPHASSSPTSAGSSDTERSINSTSSGKAPLPISVVYMDDAAKPWHSPTSSLVNIYSSSSSSSSSSSQGAAPTESRGKAHTNGWTQKLPKLFGVSGYQPDHND